MTPSRVAWHEAGHAVAGWKCARRPGPLTIVRAGDWLGSAHFSSAPVARRHDFDRLDPSRPVPLWPAAIRRRFDVIAVTAAAGDVAEGLFWLQPGRRDDTVAEQAAAILQSPMPLTRAEEILVAAERPRGRSDAETMAALGALLYEDIAPRVAWIGLAEATAAAILRANSDAVQRLATALEQHRSLSGAAVKQLLSGAADGAP